MDNFIPDNLKKFVRIKEHKCELGTIYTYAATKKLQKPQLII